MSAVFDIKEHVVEAQHIREYARATAHSQEDVLHLSVKQYIPKDNRNPKPGDITIIASHANGFVKELYEPLWEDLVTECHKKGVNVRGIWIADIAWQGQSGVLNEYKLGNDPSWMDHARDLLHVTNVFRSSMPRPIIGVGHSFGGVILCNLALMHPRLLSSLVFIDPVMSKTIAVGPLYGFTTMRASSSRRDLWPSRADAIASVRRNKFYSTWDPRAVDALVTHGFRDTPTKLYPDDKDRGKATLTSTKHHEVFTYYRPVRQGALQPDGSRALDRTKIPDATDDIQNYPLFPFYQPVGPTTIERLPALRPGALWVFGADSTVCPPETRVEKMELTGVGVGGSGGVKAGRVKQAVIEDHGHLVAMEVPGVIARHAAEFIAPEIQSWRQEENEYQAWVKGTDDRDKTVLPQEFLRLIDSVKGHIKAKI